MFAALVHERYAPDFADTSHLLLSFHGTLDDYIHDHRDSLVFCSSLEAYQLDLQKDIALPDLSDAVDIWLRLQKAIHGLSIDELSVTCIGDQIWVTYRRWNSFYMVTFRPLQTTRVFLHDTVDTIVTPLDEH